MPDVISSNLKLYYTAKHPRSQLVQVNKLRLLVHHHQKEHRFHKQLRLEDIVMNVRVMRATAFNTCEIDSCRHHDG